jgi:hypothetical protein
LKRPTDASIVKRLYPSIDRSLPAQGWPARARFVVEAVGHGPSRRRQAAIGEQTMHAIHPGNKEERGP